MQNDLEYLKGAFRHFAEICTGNSPLYAALSARVADDPEVMALATAGQPRQPPTNLLFAAVHYLLLTGVDHDLAAFYPSVGGRRPPNDAYPAFADFCHQHEQQIVELVASRRVQTNEVGRCGLLLPAFALAAQRCDRRPLYLIDVGASAGLTLLFDRYRYEYSTGHTSGPDSPARIRTELRGERPCPLPDAMPPIAGRVGVDIAPLDVRDESATRWLESLIWPDQLHRLELLRAAITIARPAPPRIITGDALELIPNLIDSAPSDALPCIFHSHTTYQHSSEWRQSFANLLAEQSRRRDLVHVSLEWLGDAPGPQLHLTHCTAAQRRTTHLADCHHHGAWLHWLADETG